ncbi:MAG: hypothetical protein ABI413_17240 [Ktedonobacteraceae bacterium]
MALTLVEFGNTPKMAGLTGVFQGQTAPEYLGLKSLSVQAGPSFFIGFDTRFRPAMVRVFFDPSQSLFASEFPWQTIGFVQIGQITYQGIPISPLTYGQGLDYLTPYVYNNFLQQQFAHYWIDMMDLGKVKAKNVDFPLFAYNGLLRNPDYPASQFFVHPMPNGSLTSNPAQSGANISLCASLYTPINLDLDSPSESVITQQVQQMISRGVVPMASQAYTHEQVISNGPLGLAIQLLQVDDPTDIESVQIVGPYMLIAFTDVEAEGPLYTAFFDKRDETQTHSTLKVFLLNKEEFEERRFAALTTTFENIKQALIVQGLTGTKGIPVDRTRTQGRGRSGLRPFPFVFSGDTNPEVAFTYRTIAVGIKQNEIQHCFGGLEWRVSRVFDRGELEFGPLRIEKPKAIISPAITFNSFKAKETTTDSNFIAPLLATFTASHQKFNFYSPSDLVQFENTGDVASPTSPGYGDSSTDWIK